MPPAFNLSQDQTLQFDLEFAPRNRSELHFSFHERLRSLDHESRDDSLNSWHPPSNAHAYRLYVVKDLPLAQHADVSSAKTEILTFFLNPRQELGNSLLALSTGIAAWEGLSDLAPAAWGKPDQGFHRKYAAAISEALYCSALSR